MVRGEGEQLQPQGPAGSRSWEGLVEAWLLVGDGIATGNSLECSYIGMWIAVVHTCWPVPVLIKCQYLATQHVHSNAPDALAA